MESHNTIQIRLLFISLQLFIFTYAARPGNNIAQVEKICENTDHPQLCLAAVLPNLLHGKIDVDTILEAAIQATNALAKNCQLLAQKLANEPGNPPKLKSALTDCKDWYDTVVDNFDEALTAFSKHDVGTMRSMLSAVITFVGDCQDGLKDLSVQSPLTGYAEKLTNMTSNCLAITSFHISDY